MKQKVTAIALILSLVAPMVTSFTILHRRKTEVKKEVSQQITAGLDKSALVLLKFTAAESSKELKWEHAKEFEYKHQMYDVVDCKVIGDTIFYWCWQDIKETKLNKQIDELLVNAPGHGPRPSENHKRLVKFYKSLYFEEHSGLIAFSQLTEEPFVVFDFPFTTISSPPPIPPPELS